MKDPNDVGDRGRASGSTAPSRGALVQAGAGADAPDAPGEVMDGGQARPVQPGGQSPGADAAKAEPPPRNGEGADPPEGFGAAGTQPGPQTGSAASDGASRQQADAAEPEPQPSKQEAAQASKAAVAAASAGGTGRRRPGRPSTVAEYDERIDAAIRARAQLVNRQSLRIRRRHKHRMSALGGDLLGAARRGDQVAIGLTTRFIEQLARPKPGTRRNPDPAFVDWDWRVPETASKPLVSWVRRERKK